MILAFTDSNLGTWVAVGLLVLGGITNLGGLIAVFATRREVDKLEERVGTSEEHIVDIRDEMKRDKTEILAAGEKRAADIHNHIERVQTQINDDIKAMPREMFAMLRNANVIKETK